MSCRAVWRAIEPHGDAALAVVLTALGECEIFLRALNSDFHGPRLLNVVIVALLALPVVWRRRAPVAALVVFWLPAQAWLDGIYRARSNLPLEPFLVLLILVYSAVAGARGARLRVVGLVLAALVASELTLLAAGLKGWGNVVPGLVFIVFAAGLGWGVRRRRHHSAALERRTVELAFERDELARRAVTAERDRIARELHDVIAHSVSVMVVQAGAAERLLDRDPPAARGALEAIRSCGTDALDELRRLLGLLRAAVPRPDGAEPQPGLDRVPVLVAQTRAAGLTVSYRTEGAARPLPPGVDLAAFRIVQEALTNVRKHAGAASVAVNVRRSPHEVRVEVTDDGVGPARPSRGGHGLVGMRERVALYGGSLSCGRVDGGFRILATIPFEGAAK